MRRYGLVAIACLMLMAAAWMVVTPAGVQAAPVQAVDRPVAIQIPPGRLTAAIFARPDLVVTVAGPARAVTGTEISVKVTVQNKGKASAPGTAGGAKGYMVDLILSSDSHVPLKPAVYPTYAGKTEADFVEDMLMRGGRISNTQNIAAGASAVYNLSVLIPKRTPPGLYCVAAYVDSQAALAEVNEANNTSCLRLAVAQPESGVRPPPGVRLWVMPYGVGGTMLNRIKPSGLVDYFDSLDGINMQNAPFGGSLGFRHGWANAIPTPGLAYYRWSYRRAGGGPWQEFNEPVAVHYVAEVGGVTSFPAYPLGPKPIAGKNLYEFKPHNPPPVAGGTSHWPTMDWFGDIYTGFLNSPALADGVYQIRLEVFNSAGAPVVPGAGFRFIVPAGVTADGTIITAPAPVSPGSTGFIFALHLDNRHCSALIDPPAIGTTTVADKCGFLLYPSKTSKVRVDFHATHPQNYATFSFRMIRGITAVTSTKGEITAATSGAFAGDGAGNFSHAFTVAELLGDCPDKAAYAERLHVYAKATRGWGRRIHAYDASYLRAFALAPVPLR